jgi:predicted transcriptional regulator
MIWASRNILMRRVFKGFCAGKEGKTSERGRNWRIYELYIFSSHGDEAMGKEAVFTMKLEKELRDEFMAAAEASHRPASQIVREMMRDFIKQQQSEADYAAFLQKKVDLARAQITAGQTLSNDEVEQEFAARRAAARGN